MQTRSTRVTYSTPPVVPTITPMPYRDWHISNCRHCDRERRPGQRRPGSVRLWRVHLRRRLVGRGRDLRRADRGGSGDEDLLYYVIADNPRGGGTTGDSCYYPDSGKWAVTTDAVEELIVKGTETEYFDGEE